MNRWGIPDWLEEEVKARDKCAGNLKLVQSLLGHSNLSTTADIYTHSLTEAEREASETLEKVIFGNLFPVVPKIGNGNSSVPN